MYVCIKMEQSIVRNRINKLYEKILTPPYLEKRRVDFTTKIENHLLNMIKTKPLYRIYYTLLPLEKHFNAVEEQTFISSIKDEHSYQVALRRILAEDFQWYRPENVRIVQSIPSEALVNRNGMSVGRGLKTSGNVVFRCLKCGVLSSTPALYWKHQESHQNYRVRVIKKKILVNKYKL